ncbi:hypothetical protein WMF45_01530 [Sorangium sp. So ce448]|uniref:hypothetical protein n=1 Tax=Sorangium sp. So ce448 TaxID=3133314 RepID=UPI003F61BD1A
MHLRATETTLTGVAGLVGFGVFLRELDVDAELQRTFGRRRRGPGGLRRNVHTSHGDAI